MSEQGDGWISLIWEGMILPSDLAGLVGKDLELKFGDGSILNCYGDSDEFKWYRGLAFGYPQEDEVVAYRFMDRDKAPVEPFKEVTEEMPTRVAAQSEEPAVEAPIKVKADITITIGNLILSREDAIKVYLKLGEIFDNEIRR